MLVTNFCTKDKLSNILFTFLLIHDELCAFFNKKTVCTIIRLEWPQS